MDIESIFEEGGLFSQTVERYEERPAQAKMAKAIEKAINKQGKLFVEAGTGVGKSLAYLVPVIRWVMKEDKKALISTYTKALQHQLVEKDIPFLKNVLFGKLRFALCVGGQNYLCPRRLAQACSYGLFDSPEESRQIDRILKWRDKTSTGLKSELDFEPVPALWGRITRESDLCQGRNCSFYNECYYMRARREQRGAHILIINHHLFFANLSSGEKVLPPYDAVVFDEAHNLEEVAGSYLGIDIANTQIKHLCDSLYNPKTKKGLLKRLRDSRLLEQSRRAVDELRTSNDFFFAEVMDRIEGKRSPVRLREPRFIGNFLSEPLGALQSHLRDLKDKASDEEQKFEINAFMSRLSDMKSQLEIFIEQSEKDHVYWISAERGHRQMRISLHAAAIDIANTLENLVFNRIPAIVLTSATLSTDDTFDYIQGRLGISQADVEILGSPFNYRDNAVLYIAKDLPDPAGDAQKFQEESLSRIISLLSITKGRTFVLFTSVRFMDEACNAMKPLLPDLNLMKQGDKPHYQLIEEFKRKENAVLLGTNTFWQGVDVPGRALECVIITKLPFAVPDEPVTEARMELMKSKNLNPFIHYQVPQAIIWLKQGFGRLVRSKDDMGMVAILDPRILTKSYGKRFLKSLPPCHVTTDLKNVRGFFRMLEMRNKWF